MRKSAKKLGSRMDDKAEDLTKNIPVVSKVTKALPWWAYVVGIAVVIGVIVL